MKPKLAGLPRRYAAALRKYLKPGSSADLLAAAQLGRTAAALGLATPELARIHKRALDALKPASGKRTFVRRAERFFASAAMPIVESHHAAESDHAVLDRLNDMTSRRAAELTVTNRELQRGIVRRQVAENAFEKNGKDQDKCLGEAFQLEKRLQSVAHGMLAAQEDERKNISRELRDEIAQTLLGLNVRLLTLKRLARSDPGGLKNEIASARRLVVASARSVRRLARELDKQPPARGSYPIPEP